MNEAAIRKYAGMMKELGLTGLEITEGDGKIRLERSVSISSYDISGCTAETSKTSESPVSNPPASKDYISVRSPIVGVFYAAPEENAKPYVSVGDSVVRGQTLCIVEAMKLINEIPAEENGIISEICVKNGQVVEYGTELFRIRR